MTKKTTEFAISRRAALMMSTGAAAALMLPTGVRAKADFTGQKVVFATWGGQYEESQVESFITPFETKTGADVIVDGPVESARLRVMLEGGASDWEVIVASESILLNLAKDDLLAEVDDTIVDLSQVLPQFRHPNGVGVEIGAYVLAHTPGSFEGEGPQTWADLFDLEKFPGKRMLQNAPTPTLEVALLADGVPKEELYPLDVERALAKLDTIKDETIFFTSHSQSQQLIIDGAVTCGFMYAARAYGANRDGADIAVSWDGNLMSMTPIFVPKNIENKDICWALVNEFLNPENQARMAELFVSAPSNPDAMPLISDEIRKWLPTEGDNLEKGVMLNAEYWRDNLESVLRRWQTWLLT